MAAYDSAGLVDGVEPIVHAQKWLLCQNDLEASGSGLLLVASQPPPVIRLAKRQRG